MSDYGFWADTSEEVTREELEARFDESLGEAYEWTQIGELEFAPGDILRELDPVAYRCGVNDYHDSLVGDGEIVEELEDEED